MTRTSFCSCCFCDVNESKTSENVLKVKPVLLFFFLSVWMSSSHLSLSSVIGNNWWIRVRRRGSLRVQTHSQVTSFQLQVKCQTIRRKHFLSCCRLQTHQHNRLLAFCLRNTLKAAWTNIWLHLSRLNNK